MAYYDFAEANSLLFSGASSRRQLTGELNTGINDDYMVIEDFEVPPRNTSIAVASSFTMRNTQATHEACAV